MAATPNYELLPLSQLKAELKKRQLPVVGIKDVLIHRLHNSDNGITFFTPAFNIPKDFPAKFKNVVLSIVRNECTKIILGRQYHDDDIFPVMIEALKLNTSITKLCIQGIALKHIDGGKLLSGLIECHPKLSKMMLSNCFLEPENTYHIAKALCENTKLKTLRLAKSQVFAKGAEYIADMLKTNSTLTALHLPLSFIECEGASAIAESLIVNTTLLSLDISFNSIKDAGTTSISRALEVNNTLQKLELDCNRDIGDPGLQALDTMLKVNTSLQVLKIDCPRRYEYVTLNQRSSY
jgi:hypothetical protein